MSEKVTESVVSRSGGRYTSIKFSVDGYHAVFALESPDTGPVVVSYTLHGKRNIMEFTSLSGFKTSIYGFLIQGLQLTSGNTLTLHQLTPPVDPTRDDIHRWIVRFFSQENETRRQITPRGDHVAFEIRHGLDEVRIYLATADRAPKWVLSKDLIEHEIGVFVCIEDLDIHFGEFMQKSVDLYKKSSSSSHSAENEEPNETPILASIDGKLDTIIRFLADFNRRLPAT